MRLTSMTSKERAWELVECGLNAGRRKSVVITAGEREEDEGETEMEKRRKEEAEVFLSAPRPMPSIVLGIKCGMQSSRISTLDESFVCHGFHFLYIHYRVVSACARVIAVKGSIFYLNNQCPCMYRLSPRVGGLQQRVWRCAGGVSNCCPCLAKRTPSLSDAHHSYPDVHLLQVIKV